MVLEVPDLEALPPHLFPVMMEKWKQHHTEKVESILVTKAQFTQILQLISTKHFLLGLNKLHWSMLLIWKQI